MGTRAWLVIEQQEGMRESTLGVVERCARARACGGARGALGGAGGLGEVDAQVVRERVGGVQAQRAVYQPLRLRRLRLQGQRAMRIRVVVRPPAAARPTYNTLGQTPCVPPGPHIRQSGGQSHRLRCAITSVKVPQHEKVAWNQFNGAHWTMFMKPSAAMASACESLCASPAQSHC